MDCELKPLLSLGAHDATGVRQVLWNPNGDISRVVSIDGSYVRLWSLDKLAAVAQTEAAPVPPSAGHTAARAMAAAWSPHSAQQITTASDRSLHGWDLRSLKYGPKRTAGFPAAANGFTSLLAGGRGSAHRAGKRT